MSANDSTHAPSRRGVAHGSTWVEDDPTEPSVDTFMREVAAAPNMVPAADAAQVAAGTVVADTFRVDSEVGHGGMGTVYRARDLRLHRDVALKLHRRARTQAADDELLAEARAMARVEHPNIVSVHDVGTVHGSVYIAMEFVPGTTLRAWLHEPRGPGVIAGMFAQVADGLAAAHDRGLIHRDFKPANVLVGEDGRPRLADFGLARTLGSERGTDPVPVLDLETDARYLPSVPQVAGTPLYMSPEQVRGEPLDGRSDQYSFFVALFEALHGRAPYPTRNLEALIHAVSSGRLEVPTTRAVPRWLRRVVMRGLSFEPEKRYPSMRAVASALRRGPRTRWLLAGLLAAGGVAAIVASTGEASGCAAVGERVRGVWSSSAASEVARRIRAAPVPAAPEVAERTRARLDAWSNAWATGAMAACEADDERQLDCHLQAASKFAALVAALRTEDAMQPEAATHLLSGLPELGRCRDTAALARSVAPPEGEVQVAAVQRVRHLLEAVAVQKELTRYASAVELARTAVDEARDCDYPPVVAEALLAQGRAEHFAGAYHDAQRSLEDAFHLGSELEYERVVVDAATFLVSNAVGVESDTTIGDQWTRHALAALDRLGDRSEQKQQLLTALGNLAQHRGDLQTATAHHRRALALAEGAPSPDPPAVARSLQNVGVALTDAGRYAEAYEHFARALQIERTDPDHSRENIARAHHNLGAVSMYLARHEDANQHFEQALELKTHWLGPRHPSLAETLDGLGSLEAERGDHAASKRYFARALAIREAALGPGHPDLADSHINLAHALGGLGDAEGSIDHDHRAIAILEATVGAAHYRVGAARNNLGSTLLELGRFDEAERELLAARLNWENALGEEHPVLINALVNLGAVYLGQGRRDDALAVLERAYAMVEHNQPEPALAGEVRFTLAKALWSDPEERARATQLLDAARIDLVHAGGGASDLLSELDRWR